MKILVLDADRERVRTLEPQLTTAQVRAGYAAGDGLQLANSGGWDLVATRQNRLDEAEKWLSLVVDLRQSLRAPADRAAWYHDLGTLRGKQERHYEVGRVYLGRGNIARAQGDEGGLTFYEKALEIAREKDLRALEGEVLLEYARLRKRMGGAEEAQAYLGARAHRFFRARRGS